MRTTVGTVLVPATATSLRGVSRVNLDHLDTSLLCLVYQEAMELRETPIMESTLCFRMLLHRGAFTNVRQVLKDNGTAGGSVLNETLRKYMVVISSLADLFFGETVSQRASASGVLRSLCLCFEVYDGGGKYVSLVLSIAFRPGIDVEK